jgi:putative CocE/NonD family hydrolase
MSPVAGAAGHFRHSIFRRGVFELRWRLAYFTAMERVSYHRAGTYRAERDRLDSYVQEPRALLSLLTDEAYRHLPLRDWGERLQGQAPYLREIMEHSADGPFWAESDVIVHPEAVRVPAFHVSSWYDAFQSDILGAFTAFRSQAATEEARRGQRLLMGPWAHLQPYSTPTSCGTGDVDFGEEALIDLHGLQLRWFDRWLKGLDDGRDDRPAVRLFVMGINRWRDEEDWPLARAVERRLYLHSGGAANTVDGDGTLSWAGPAEEPADRFTYDPDHPVPTMGGTIIGPGAGVYDQRPVEGRLDVLVYTGGILGKDLEVTGVVEVELWAATSADDADFTAKVVDVHPDGCARNIVDGIVRARYRDSLTEPTPIRAGEVFRFVIDLWATSHVFLAGHRIRLEISSSSFPRYDRNAGSGLPFGEDTVLHQASQRVFHDSARPSAIVLPTVPGGGR